MEGSMIPSSPSSNSSPQAIMINLFAGGATGVVAKVVSAPMERVKLILQTQKVNDTISIGSKYKGTVDCIVRVYREQGLFSFWRGTVANVVRYYPNQAMSFAFKDMFKDFFVGSTSRQDNILKFYIGNLLSSGIAGGAALALCYPLDMARTRLATDVSMIGQPRQFTGTIDCLLKLYRFSGGMSAIYAGFPVALGGVVMFKALFMGGYDIAKDYSPSNHIAARILVAQVVTAVAGTALYPMDTVRRRMMMSAKNLEGNGTLYKSGLHCFSTIIREEGVRGLYHGLAVNLLRSVSGPILLVGYEEFRQLVEDTLSPTHT